MRAYDELMAFQRDTEALRSISMRLGWDQETMMPAGAGEQRAEEMAAIEGVLHARRMDPRVGDWLAAAGTGETDVEEANLREIRRGFDRASKVPAALAVQLAETTSKAQGIWAKARAAEDVGMFLPTLTEVVNLRREEAAALSDGGPLYDALLEDYEPGTSGDEISALFNALRPELTALQSAVMDAVAPERVTGTFGEAQQLALSERLAQAFGYSLDHGRIDKAVHPFCSGNGLDVRITTRTDESDPLNCIYSTIHEVGHASYEQNVDPCYRMTPLGRGVSMGVHESQSRIYENQLGRSRAFTGWLFDEMRDVFGPFGLADAEAFYKSVNGVRKGFIRTEADEIQYNLHVMLRFDLERALVAGDLVVADLEAAWNDRFARDFGYAVDKPSNGLLQDVHWAVGLFGYFPTYTLGNVYAGCLYAAMRDDLDGLDSDLAQGDTSAAREWLAQRLQRHGGLRSPRDTIKKATGKVPSEAPLISYLQSKFGDLYAL